MSIVSCPRCGDKVSIPPAASPSALVQCPLCLEEYYLSDALIQLPPMLVVVGGHAASEKEGDYRLAEPVTAAVSGAVFDTSGGTSATVAPRPQLRTVPRPRRQEKSAVGEIVKVVLGGMAGLAGGLLVLWWGFGVDVGDLGPKLSKVEYLRFLVPPKLWDQSVQRHAEPQQLDTLDANTPSKGQASGTSEKEKNAGKEDSNSAFGGGSFGSAASSPSEEPVQSGDPLLTLDPLAPDSKSSIKPEEDLKIGNPLKELKPPPKSGADDKTPKEAPAKRDDHPATKSSAPSEDDSSASEKRDDSKSAGKGENPAPPAPADPDEPPATGEKPSAKEPQEPRPE